MAGIVDPEVVILAIEDMLSAPVVWLDRKSWLSIYPLIGTDLIVVDSNLDVFSRNSCLHDSIHKGVDGKACIEDVIHNQNLLALLKIIWRPSPAINVYLVCVFNKLTIASCYNCCVEYRFTTFLRALKLVVFTDDICKISSTA